MIAWKLAVHGNLDGADRNTWVRHSRCFR